MHRIFVCVCLVLAAWGCRHEDASATRAPERVATATRVQWQKLCDCDPESKLCAQVKSDGVFTCMERVLYQSRAAIGDKLECWASESERIADCYSKYGCDKASTDHCVTGSHASGDSVSEFCGKLPTPVNDALEKCLEPTTDAGVRGDAGS